MSERPTPETDAMAVTCYGESGIENSFGFRAVPIEDCRKLERERDEARTTIADAKRALNATDYEGILLAAMRVKEERDEARAERDAWRNHAERFAAILSDETPLATIGTDVVEALEEFCSLKEECK